MRESTVNAPAPIAGRDAFAAAFSRVWTVFAFAILPAATAAAFLLESHARGTFALDFHHAFLPAARDIINGTFSYPADIGYALGTSDPYVYPPVAAVLLAPFTLLPDGPADFVFVAAGVAALFVSLRLLGVRDWRCYGITFLWLPVLQAVQTANLTLLLLAGLAALWVSRDRPLRAGVVAALLVSAKLFLWPAFAWLLLTRRYRAAVWCVVVGAAVNAAAWIAADGGSVTAYLRMAKRASDLQAPGADTIRAVAQHWGAPAPGLLVWPAVVALAAVWWAGRSDERFAFGMIVVVALVASPIVWLHYLSLLLAPVALGWPRLAWPWFAPLVLMVAVQGQDEAVPLEASAAIVLVLVVAAAGSRRELVRPERRRQSFRNFPSRFRPTSASVGTQAVSSATSARMPPAIEPNTRTRPASTNVGQS